jgi:CRP-like cAMP-binding protein
MSEGRMRLSRPGAPDWVYEGRWVVGTTDVLAGRARTRTAVMETDARLFRLPSERWFEVMQDRPEVLLDAITGFARGIAALHLRLEPDGGFETGSGATSDVSTLAGRVCLLASLPLLRGAPMQVLAELAEIAEVTDLAADETLRPGAPAERIFVVTRGRIEGKRSDPDVRSLFSAGSMVCGALGLGDAEGAWSARAVEPSQVLSFSVDTWFDHIEEHIEGVRAMMAACALERDRLCDMLGERLGELVLR